MGEQDKFSESQTISYEELSIAEETDEQRAINMQLFRDNLEFILNNSKLILNTPEYFFIRHRWALAGGAYVGSKYIPLGVLIMLWQNGEWLGHCPNCDSQTYIFCAGGSPLSGSYFYQAACIACKAIVNEELASGLAALLKPAFDLCNTYAQKRKILRTKGQCFSWGKGVVGEASADKILEDVVESVDLKVLVTKFK